MSTPGQPVATATWAVANFPVRRLLGRITDRLDPSQQEDWTKTRNYLYHATDKLTIEQVDRVLDFLEESFSRKTCLHIVQQTPRVLRKNCRTKLAPVRDLLLELFGPETVDHALQSRPNLLLTRGLGYDAAALHLPLVEVLLKDELSLRPTQLDKLRRTYPAIFQASAAQLLDVIQFLRNFVMATAREGRKPQTYYEEQFGKVLVANPQIFLLSVPGNLNPTVSFLKVQCELSDADLGEILCRRAAPLFGLSIDDNLRPTLDLLSQRLSATQISKVVRAHPQLLCLAKENLAEKVAYFDSLENRSLNNSTVIESRNSLAARVLARAPTVFSLNLDDNIVPKVEFLLSVWGVPDNESSRENTRLLGEYPSVLGLSLPGNIQPTVEFYNSTGYVKLDREWQARPSTTPTTVLRGRDIAASLSNRLLPRWHFWLQLIEEENGSVPSSSELPLHVLVSATDQDFCKLLKVDLREYAEFKRESVPRLRFRSQFNTWLRSGIPIATEE